MLLWLNRKEKKQAETSSNLETIAKFNFDGGHEAEQIFTNENSNDNEKGNAVLKVIEDSISENTKYTNKNVLELNIAPEQRLFHYISKEFEAVAKNPIEGIYVTPGADSLLVWFGLLIVRTGIFCGGIFRFVLTLPDNFPDSEALPVFQFEEPFFHPLVNPKSNCVDLSRYFPSGWQRDRNHIYQVLIATQVLLGFLVQSIFFSCHCDSMQAANPEAAILLKENRKKFVQMAHDTVRRSRTQVYAAPNSDDPNAIRFTPWDQAKMEPFRQYLLGKSELPSFSGPDQTAFNLFAKRNGFSWMDAEKNKFLTDV